MERFKLIVSVYLFLIKKDKILLLRRYNTGYEDGNYSLPAGHLDNNETITNALCREVKEEIGVKVKPESTKLVHIMHRKENDIRVDFFYTTKKYEGKPTNTEPEKCDDLRWSSLKNLPKNTVPYISFAIKNYLNNVLYSEIGWQTDRQARKLNKKIFKVVNRG